ncbi:hypothetical protein [Companilactobacillus zhongbaensis]|uniref:hypothetical protein n=1 Tax=Companilactobacillus zhongbaensis TaxID=2486009 RepID=UPI0013DDE496|nr:hypothetical protein [Companilactobacillus zhongbaensis]
MGTKNQSTVFLHPLISNKNKEGFRIAIFQTTKERRKEQEKAEKGNEPMKRTK